MTAPPTEDRAIELLETLPIEETWSQHYIDDERRDGKAYCYPCMRRVVGWLQRFVELRWISHNRLSEFDWGEDSYQLDVVTYCCHHCGVLLDGSLSDEGVDMELDHFEACSSDKLREVPRHEIERLMWHFDQDTKRGKRVRTVVNRCLEAHGLVSVAEAGAS